MNGETLLGYAILVGLLLTPALALLHGYYVVTAPVVGEADNPLLTPTGPFINVTGIEVLSPGAALVTEEYRITGNLLWVTVTLTAAALLARVFLHMQKVPQVPGEEESVSDL